MEIKFTEESIESARLFTLSRYAEKLGVAKTTILYRILTGKLRTVEVSGIKMVVHEGKEI